MSPIDVVRTTSFRVGTLFLLLFGLASAGLFGLIYWQTAGYMESETDDWLRRESAGILSRDEPDLATLVAQRMARDPQQRRPVGLFEASGTALAGNLRQVAFPVTLDTPFTLTVARVDEQVTLRAIARQAPRGQVLVLAQDVHDLAEFEELLTHAMLIGGLLILGTGLGGAVVLGSVASRRVDKVTRAIQRIVQGDLSQRLPDHGAHDDMARLIRVVNAMLEDIERLMQEVKGVCDNVAHDLRTPLTRLMAGLERVRRRGASAEEYGLAVDQAIAELSTVLATFSAMLRISEIEDGQRRGGFVALDLRRIAEDVLDYYVPGAEEAGIRLCLLPSAPQAVPMQGDPSLLFEALGNLVENALKFTPKGGEVAIILDAASVSVADTGPGIPPEIREQVLKRFVRGEDSRHTSGNGLGLSMVAAVARLHGMSLTIGGNAGCVVSLRLGG